MRPKIVRRSPRAAMLMALAALAAFCVVQDRTVAAGAAAYVERQREAAEGRSAPVTVDAIMRPWIERSVRAGALAAAPFLVLAVAFVSGRRDA